MWSVAGVWYFYFTEAALGFPNVHAPIKDGSFDVSSAFTFDSVYKFWLGFVIFPMLWMTVGAVLGARAVAQISAEISAARRQQRSKQR